MNFARPSKKQLVSDRSCITWNADEAVVTTKSKIELNSVENCLSLTFSPRRWLRAGVQLSGIRDPGFFLFTLKKCLIPTGRRWGGCAPLLSWALVHEVSTHILLARI